MSRKGISNSRGEKENRAVGAQPGTSKNTRQEHSFFFGKGTTLIERYAKAVAGRGLYHWQLCGRGEDLALTRGRLGGDYPTDW